ncbi:MAG TPA: DUF29 domain-containing protein [Geminicoccaceae bacterium]
MPTRVRTRSSELYERDFYAWTREQATLLRAGRYDELDLEHLSEEVEDLGGSLYRSVRSRMRTIIEHLLKLEHSPAAEPRSLWRDTIQAQRADLEDDLTASLRRRLQSELPKHYLRARAAAARSLRRYGETAAADALPETCPYTLDQIVGDWLP